MSEDELRDTRASLFAAFLTLLELSWSDRETITDAAVVEAADSLDEAIGQLTDAIREDRRHGSIDDRRPRA